MNALTPPSRLKIVDLLEEIDTLREAVRRYEELLKPSLYAPLSWRLTPHEEAVLLVLYGAKTRVVHRERMLIGVYGILADAPEQKILDVFVCKVRRKLMEAQTRISIDTVWGRGWRLNEENHARLHAAITGESIAERAA
ncbi:winged helix-turn-helix domain-containing protein [Methylobacterium sp. Gmos1]